MTRKLVIGLATAGLFLAGFGGAVIPASAEPHHYMLKLATGITVPWTGEPGSAPATITVAGVPIAVVSVQDLGAVVQQVTPTPTPAPAPSTTPAQTTPAPTTPSQPKQSKTTEKSTSTSSSPSAAPKPAKQSTSREPSGGAKTQQQPTSGQTSEKPKSDDANKPSTKAKKKTSDKPAKKDTATTTEDKADPVPATHTPPKPTNPTFSLAQPGAAAVGVPNFFIDKFRIPPFLLPIYQAAGVQYGIRWEILAAINEIETDYGRNLNVSSAGALGWMQFMPATWKLYGTDANHDGKRDPYNPVDAIFATARYLKAAGGEADINRAIFAYNHADWYVDSVLMRARLITGLPADLVGSLTGLTQGHFPVHAEARYADDISPTKAGKKVKKGNAANPVESSKTRKGINIYAKAGSPVIAVQDGRVVKIGNDDRLGKFIMLRDAYGNTYTYGRLKKLAHNYPVPKSQSVSQTQVDKELSLSKSDPKPTKAACRRLAGGLRPRAARASPPARPRRRSRRSACSPTRTARARTSPAARTSSSTAARRSPASRPSSRTSPRSTASAATTSSSRT